MCDFAEERPTRDPHPPPLLEDPARRTGYRIPLLLCKRFRNNFGIGNRAARTSHGHDVIAGMTTHHNQGFIVTLGLGNACPVLYAVNWLHAGCHESVYIVLDPVRNSGQWVRYSFMRSIDCISTKARARPHYTEHVLHAVWTRLERIHCWYWRGGPCVLA